MATPFKLRRDGTIDVRLSPVEAEVLQQVAEQVAEAIDRESEDAVRLFPPAYVDDNAQQEEFQAVTRGDLTALKKQAVEQVVGTLRAGVTKGAHWRGSLDEETSRAWLSVLNDARLILGTSLAVTDDSEFEPLAPGDERAPAFNLYLYLGGLEEMLIDVLAARDLKDLPVEEDPWD